MTRFGSFWQILATNFSSTKNSQNIWETLWAIVKNGTIKVKQLCLLFGQLLDKLGYFSFQHLVTLVPFSLSTGSKRKQKIDGPKTDCIANQRDQIGLFLNDLGDKFPYKSSPNIWHRVGMLQKASLLTNNWLLWIPFGQLFEKWELFVLKSSHAVANVTSKFVSYRSQSRIMSKHILLV